MIRLTVPLQESVPATIIANQNVERTQSVSSRESKRKVSLLEHALKESQQKLTVLFTKNPDPVIFCDKDFQVTNINPSFTALFGYTLDEAKGKDISDLLVPKNLTDETASIRRELLEGPTQRNTTRLRKDGSEAFVSLSASPLFVDGVISGHLLVYKDITDLVFANKELSGMFQEIERMLNAANLLNEKLSVTGSLTRHDVRNKLSAIASYVYIAKKRLVGNEEVENCLKQIEEVIKNIVKILEFAKTFEMLGTQERTLIDVGKMVNNATSLFADLKGITVKNECEGFQVKADSLLMELFHNFIDNSLKYGEKISQIRVYVNKKVDGTEIIYEDDGAGVDLEIKKRLFQKGAGKGTGYGLWLIKRICEMYGWNITENGKLGKGVRFVMFIPETLN